MDADHGITGAALPPSPRGALTPVLNVLVSDRLISLVR